jgi:hypothetical protein
MFPLQVIKIRLTFLAVRGRLCDPCGHKGVNAQFMQVPDTQAGVGDFYRDTYLKRIDCLGGVVQAVLRGRNW